MAVTEILGDACVEGGVDRPHGTARGTASGQHRVGAGGRTRQSQASRLLEAAMSTAVTNGVIDAHPCRIRRAGTLLAVGKDESAPVGGGEAREAVVEGDAG